MGLQRKVWWAHSCGPGPCDMFSVCLQRGHAAPSMVFNVLLLLLVAQCRPTTLVLICSLIAFHLYLFFSFLFFSGVRLLSSDSNNTTTSNTESRKITCTNRKMGEGPARYHPDMIVIIIIFLTKKTWSLSCTCIYLLLPLHFYHQLWSLRIVDLLCNMLMNMLWMWLGRVAWKSGMMKMQFQNVVESSNDSPVEKKERSND